MKKLLLSILFINTFFFLNGQGNVGINDTGAEPDTHAILDVQSTSKGMLVPRMDESLRDIISASPTVPVGLLIFNTTSNTFNYWDGSQWQDLGSGQSVWSENGNDIYYNDGNVGIGTATPQAFSTDRMLEVQGKDQVSGAILNLRNSDESHLIRLASGRDNDPNPALFWKGGDSLRIFTANPYAEIMRITDSGKLGIGLTRPEASLHLADQKDVLFGNRYDSVGSRMFWLSGKAAFWSGSLSSLGSSGWSQNNLGNASFSGGGLNNHITGGNSFIGGGNNNSVSGLSAAVAGGGSNSATGNASFIGGGLQNTAAAYGSFIGGGEQNETSGQESFIGGGRINEASGNYSFIGGGLNLIAPSYIETVFGRFNEEYTAASTNSWDFSDRLFVIGNGTSSSNRSNALTILKSGLVGIGTSSPARLLHLKVGTGTSIIARFESQNTNGSTIDFRDPNTTGDWLARIGGKGDGLTFIAGGLERMRILADGNLGIGVPSPSEKLEINGAINIKDASTPTPAAGTIRWNPATEDFEGYTGSEWKSLTQGNEMSWGGMASNHETQKITSFYTDGNDQFGYWVSFSGDYAIIGAPQDEPDGIISGSASIYQVNNFSLIEQALLVPNDGANNDNFGDCVDISGSYSIIGAPENDDNGSQSGSAYIFQGSGTNWSQEDKLTASDAEVEDYFGFSVAISGDYAVVGAPFDDDNGNFSGSAYVFHRSGSSWIQQAKLIASDGTNDDNFGWSIDISGDYAVVGAPFDGQGSAYIFARSGSSWTEQVKLTSSTTTDDFGFSVAIFGDTVIVGAPRDDDLGFGSGAAYIFYRSGTNWTEQYKLKACDAAAVDLFGSSVAVDRNSAIIGANSGEPDAAAYIFGHSGNNWVQQAKLTGSDTGNNDEFGRSVGISGNYAIVGALGNDEEGSGAGAAYFFVKSQKQ